MTFNEIRRPVGAAVSALALMLAMPAMAQDSGGDADQVPGAQAGTAETEGVAEPALPENMGDVEGGQMTQSEAGGSGSGEMAADGSGSGVMSDADSAVESGGPALGGAGGSGGSSDATASSGDQAEGSGSGQAASGGDGAMSQVPAPTPQTDAPQPSAQQAQSGNAQSSDQSQQDQMQQDQQGQMPRQQGQMPGQQGQIQGQQGQMPGGGQGGMGAMLDIEAFSQNIYERGFRQGYIRGIADARERFAQQMEMMQMRDRQMQQGQQGQMDQQQGRGSVVILPPGVSPEAFLEDLSRRNDMMQGGNR